jgi:transformation/transcription domain-associated protein
MPAKVGVVEDGSLMFSLQMLAGAGDDCTYASLYPQADSGTGVKTKVQLQAERNVLVALLSAILAAAADEKLADVASPFARNMCRHFGMLFAAGTQPPPPAPAVFRHEARTEPQSAPAMPQGLRELDIHLFLDALIEVLCDKAPARARAALDGLATFLDTLLMLHEAKSKIGKPADAAQPGDGAGPAAMDVAAPPASAAQGDGRSQQQQPTASEQAATAGQDQQQKGSGEGGTADGSAQAQQQKPPEARTPSARLSKVNGVDCTWEERRQLHDKWCCVHRHKFAVLAST